MGCWMMAEDRIEIVPGANDALIREFIEFSIISCLVSGVRRPLGWF